MGFLPSARNVAKAPDQPVPDTSPPDLAQREDARARARHIVVLMLENRSFDHLLAFSGHQGITPLLPGSHGNLVRDRPNQPEPPNGQGSAVLTEDPPHSHDGAKRQMGSLVAGVPAMDGFVEAYRLKLEGKEHLPVIHWKRAAGAALTASPLVGAAAQNLVRRLGDGWTGFGSWWLAPGGAVGAVLLGRPFGRASGLAPWKIATGAFAVTTIVSAGSEGLWRFVKNRDGTIVPWTLGAALVLSGGVLWQREKHRQSLQPEEDAAARSLEIMRCLPPGEAPVLTGLAKQFVVCERWFSSVPGATWPNRNFLHSGTSEQSVDIEVGLYESRTIFELLDDAHGRGDSGLTDPPWRIYRDGTPQVLCFKRLWQSPEQEARWCDMDDFTRDAGSGKLASYSFIEPRHSGGSSNSMHPGNNMEVGHDGTTDLDRSERLVKRVYDAIGRCPGGWGSTVLVVTFDEHGGTFDRVPPPKAVPPDVGAAVRHPLFSLRRAVAWFVEHRNAPFDFRRYGIRVPTLVISPWVETGGVDRHDYDHTSIPETVRQLLAPDEKPLGRRARLASPLWNLLVAGRTTALTMPECPPPRGGARPVGRRRPEEAGSRRPAESNDRTGGDIEAQLALLEEKARTELATRPGASAIAEGGEGDAVDRFRAWARRSRAQQPGT